MGTSLDSVCVLSKLIQLNIEISAVFTRPAKPSGRGRGVRNSPIKEYVDNKNIDLFQYNSLINNQDAYNKINDISPDLIIVADFGLIIPVEILKLPLLGCLNIHPSLLPRYRGPSPVSFALLNEKKLTGVTIMLMDEGLDTGAIVAQKNVEFLYQENAEGLTKRLFQIGALLLIDILFLWEKGKIKTIPQNEAEATYTKKLSKEDGKINWSNSAIEINKKILAYTHWPGAFTYWNSKRIKIIEASVGDVEFLDDYSKGIVFQLDNNLHVMTGEGSLILNKIQLAGKKVILAKEFIQGYKDFMHAKLE